MAGVADRACSSPSPTVIGLIPHLLRPPQVNTVGGPIQGTVAGSTRPELETAESHSEEAGWEVSFIRP